MSIVATTFTNMINTVRPYSEDTISLVFVEGPLFPRMREVKLLLTPHTGAKSGIAGTDLEEKIMTTVRCVKDRLKVCKTVCHIVARVLEKLCKACIG